MFTERSVGAIAACVYRWRGETDEENVGENRYPCQGNWLYSMWFCITCHLALGQDTQPMFCYYCRHKSMKQTGKPQWMNEIRAWVKACNASTQKQYKDMFKLACSLECVWQMHTIGISYFI